MRKNRFAALAMIYAAASKISADGHAQDRRALEVSVRTPTHHAKLIPNLHHRRPDVVKELDFRHRLQSARGHANRAAHDAGFGQRGIENAVSAVFALQSGGGLENAALPFYIFEIFFAAGIGDVLAEDSDALIKAHFIVQSGGPHFYHGLRPAVELGPCA